MPPPPPRDDGGGGQFARERGVIRELEAYVAQVAASARGQRAGTSRADRQTLRATIRQMIDAITRRPFEIVMPGTHRDARGGRSMANMDLLAILEARGMPFAEVTRSMLNRAKTDLTLEFENATEIPLLLDLEQTMQDSVKDTILGRFEGRLRDVRIKANSQRYRRWKVAHGFDSRAGVMGGGLMGSVSRIRLRFLGRRPR